MKALGAGLLKNQGNQTLLYNETQIKVTDLVLDRKAQAAAAPHVRDQQADR